MSAKGSRKWLKRLISKPAMSNSIDASKLAAIIATLIFPTARVAKLVDAVDSKSTGVKTVPVRVRPLVPVPF